jgi:WD40 repeat protein
LLQEHVDGSLPSGAEAEMVAHLDGCERCREALESLASGGQAWLAVARGLGADPPLPTVNWNRIAARLSKADAADTEPELLPLLMSLGLADEAGRLGRLDHYALEEVIGRGSMGVVFKAFDEKLRRVVAIKVMSPLWGANRAARERFLREARAAAAIRDEHVVAVHAVEECRGLPYLVTDFIPGGSLQHRLDVGGPISVDEVVRIGREVALGLAAAHALGLVHRDIKPANVLLDATSGRAKIVDFGLARSPDDAGLTHDGIVVGTPQFMAPEQARGEPVDHRADLFSLGSVLHTLCTGRPPFAAGDPLSVLRRIAEDVPAPVRELHPDVPDWLEGIITGLMAKDPAVRIPLAAAVAESLDRRGGPPVRLAPKTIPWNLARPAQPRRGRRRVVGSLAAVVLLASAGLALSESSGVTHLGATLIRVFTPEGVLSIAVDDPDIKVSIEGQGGIVINGAGLREVRLRPGSYRVSATRAGKTVREELVTITRGGKQVVTIDREPSQAVQAIGEVHAFLGHIGDVKSVAFAPDGCRALSGGADGTVRLWDLETGNILRQFPHGAWIWSVAFSPDGRSALSAGRDGIAHLWDFKTGEERRRLEGHGNPVGSAVFSPDGRFALTGGDDKTMRLWDLETGRMKRLFRGHEDCFRVVAFLGDGRRAVSGSHDRTVRIWDLESGQEMRCLRGHEREVHCLAVSPDGHRVLSGSRDFTLRLWDVESGELVRRIDGPREVSWVAYSPDGRRALSVSWDHAVRLWDLETGQRLHVFESTAKDSAAVAFSPDGRLALSGGTDGIIRLWRLPP